MIYEHGEMADKTRVGPIPSGSSVDADQPPPRVAFLGLCDRSAEITVGAEASWHTNILGISHVKLFHVFPTSIQGLRYMAAIYNPTVGEQFTIRFRPPVGGRTLEVSMGVQGGEVLEKSTGTKRALAMGEPIPGWTHVVQSFPKGSQLLEPGSYEVTLATGGKEQYLATVNFLHLPTPPLTQERLAAIRSDPLATKLVKMEFKCNKCTDSVRAYAGMEKNTKLEGDGWVWFEELPDRFQCTCGLNDINLEYIRTGLHGVLSRRLAPTASDPALSTVRLYEQSALEEQARNFTKLINRNAREEDIQAFLEQHPVFFSLFIPTKLMAKPPILTRYKADFAILTSRKELLLVEIERATLKLLKQDGGLHSKLQHAVDQVRDWLRTLDDHRVAALDALGLTLDEVAAVKGVVIAGRTPHDKKQIRIFRSLSFPEISVYTYEDLLSAVKEIIRQAASV